MPGKAIPLDPGVGVLPGGLEVFSPRGDGGDAAPGGDDGSVLLELRPGVEDGPVLAGDGGGEAGAGDDAAELGIVRIAGRAEDDGDGGEGVELQRQLAEFPLRDGGGDVEEGGFEQREDGLGLGVAEADVDLEHLRGRSASA